MGGSISCEDQGSTRSGDKVGVLDPGQVACTDVFIRNVRSLLILRAGVTSVGASLPVLASVLAFIVYGINHPLDPATIFTSLTLFNMLRLPLMFFRKPPPFSCMLSAVSDSERQQRTP